MKHRGDSLRAAERDDMVESQLRPRGVCEPDVLAAMRDIPREWFVPEPLLSRAYEDAALPSDCGQTISQPFIVARMTELLDVRPAHRVLEIGTGTGYQTAILARLASRVYTVEWYMKLAIVASERLTRLGARNVAFRCGDGSLGWPVKSPFDRIMVTAGAPAPPAALCDQLVEGGLMVLPVRDADGEVLAVLRRTNGRFDRRDVLPCRFVRLHGEQGWRD